MPLHLTIFAKAEGFPIMLVVTWGTLCVSKCWKVVPVKQLGSFKKSRSDVEDVDDCSFSIEGAWWGRTKTSIEMWTIFWGFVAK